MFHELYNAMHMFNEAGLLFVGENAWVTCIMFHALYNALHMFNEAGLLFVGESG